MKVSLIAALLLAAAAPISVAAQAPASVAVDAEHEKIAGELTRVLNSEALMRAQIGKMLDDTLPKTFAASPDFAAMEREHPGITKAVIDAMRPIILNGTLSRSPALTARLTPIYARSFTTAELHTLLDFYTSPAGQRVIKAMGEGADFSRLLSDMIANDGTATTEGLRAGVQSGAAEVIRTATPDDIKTMEALFATSLGAKMRAVSPKVQAESVAWGNEPDPELDAQVESAVKDAITRYLGKPKQ